MKRIVSILQGLLKIRTFNTPQRVTMTRTRKTVCTVVSFINTIRTNEYKDNKKKSGSKSGAGEVRSKSKAGALSRDFED